MRTILPMRQKSNGEQISCAQFAKLSCATPDTWYFNVAPVPLEAREVQHPPVAELARNRR